MESSPSVFVVDDNYAFRETLRLILSSEGFSTAGAANGQEALDHLSKSSSPDLILLDLAMPVMDGMTFLRHQRQSPKLASIPVVMMSSDPELPEYIAAAGVAGYVQKPFRAAELLDAIEPAVRLGRHHA